MTTIVVGEFIEKAERAENDDRVRKASSRGAAQIRGRALNYVSGTQMGYGDADDWALATLAGWNDDPNTFIESIVDRAIIDLNAPDATRHNVARDAIFSVLMLCAGGDVGSDGERRDGNPGGARALEAIRVELVRVLRESNTRSGEVEGRRLIIGALERLRAEIETGARQLTGRLWGDYAAELDEDSQEAYDDWQESIYPEDAQDAETQTSDREPHTPPDPSADVPPLCGNENETEPVTPQPDAPTVTAYVDKAPVAAPVVTTPLPAAPAISEADFWKARPVLTHIQQFARSRRLSPWALFGNILVRVMANVPPNHVAPPSIGADGSVNLFTGLVGPSGSGKGTSSGAADDCIDLGDIYEAVIGSGEGIAKQFGYTQPAKSGNPAELIRTRDAVVLTAAEIGTIGAIQGRNGSSLLSELCKAYSGEALGRSNMSEERTVIIPAHSYRLGALVGVQPAKAGVLFDDTDGGTPQRFLWLPAQDADMPDIKPPEPPRLPNPLPPALRPTGAFAGLPGTTPLRKRLTLPTIATDAIDRAAVQRHRGQSDALDGHALFTRVKVTYALTFLDGRLDPTDEDWNLAGAVMAKSDATRDACRKTIRDAANAQNINRGKADGVRAAVADDEKHRTAVKRVVKKIEATLADGDWHASSDIRRALRSTIRTAYDDAAASLELAARIEVEDSPNGQGKRLRRKPAE